MIAAAARRESADPSDSDTAQTSGTAHGTDGAAEENDILSMVGTSDNLLINPTAFGLNSEIAMYSADDAVMSECQTEPENNKLTSNSFNVESAFGTAPAPFDLTETEKILNEEVIVETPYRSPSDVEVVFGGGATPFDLSVVEDGTPQFNDIPILTIAGIANPFQSSDNIIDFSDNPFSSNANNTANNFDNVQEPLDYIQSLTKDKIMSLVDNLDELARISPDPFLQKLKENIRFETEGLSPDSQEYKDKAHDIAMVHLLKSINDRSVNLSERDRLDLIAESSIVQTELMEGRVRYYDWVYVTINGQQVRVNQTDGFLFIDNYGNYTPHQTMVCSQHANFGLYYAGITSANDPVGHNTWRYSSYDYEYPPGFPVGGVNPDTNGMWGVSNLAYNRTLLSPTDYNKQYFRNIGDNPSPEQVRELESLKGTMLFTRSQSTTGPQDHRGFRGYSHVQTIVGYNILTNSLIITESCGENVVRKHEISVNELSRYRYCDVYRPNLNTNR